MAHRALTAERRGRRRPPPTSANRAHRGAGTTLLAAVGPHDPQVVDQVEVVLEAHLALVEPAGGQAAHVRVQGDVSPVVAGRGGGQLDLADDLGPQVQGGLGRLPGLKRQLGQVGPRGGGLLDLVMARRSSWVSAGGAGRRRPGRGSTSSSPRRAPPSGQWGGGRGGRGGWRAGWGRSRSSRSGRRSGTCAGAPSCHRFGRHDCEGSPPHPESLGAKESRLPRTARPRVGPSRPRSG